MDGVMIMAMIGGIVAGAAAAETLIGTTLIGTIKYQDYYTKEKQA